jgi:hypothetical protein
MTPAERLDVNRQSSSMSSWITVVKPKLPSLQNNVHAVPLKNEALLMLVHAERHPAALLVLDVVEAAAQPRELVREALLERS